MKLAEALQERADLNRQIEQLKARLYNNALVQEGEAPAEDPNELLAQLDRSTARRMGSSPFRKRRRSMPVGTTMTGQRRP